MENSIRQAASAGFSGAAMWDSSFNFRSRDDCLDIQKYLEKTLGPYIRSFTDDVKRCAASRCNGHGRCVDWSAGPSVLTPLSSSFIGSIPSLNPLMDLLCGVSRRLFSHMLGRFFPSMFNNATSGAVDVTVHGCTCYPGWSGNDCSKTAL